MKQNQKKQSGHLCRGVGETETHILSALICAGDWEYKLRHFCSEIPIDRNVSLSSNRMGAIKNGTSQVGSRGPTASIP